jgi:hypothetical protein
LQRKTRSKMMFLNLMAGKQEGKNEYTVIPKLKQDNDSRRVAAREQKSSAFS